MTKQYKRDQAVAWLKRELELLRRAGYVNGRNLTYEEQEQIEVFETALEALGKEDA